MKILILEDDENRIEWFLKKFFKHTVWITKLPQEANQWIQDIDFDFIFLDHDLQDEHYASDVVCNETTGLCTAEFLSANEHLCRSAEIIIHSMNYYGSERMLNALKNRNSKSISYPILRQNLIVY